MRPGPRTPRPTVLGPLRRPAPYVAVVAFLVFLVLAARYAGDPLAGRVDRRTGSLVDRLTADHGGFFARAVDVGAPVPVLVWAMVLVLVALALLRPRHAVLAVAGPGVTGVATTLLKPVIGRTLGGPGEFAYPSGHTAGATAIALAAALLLVSFVPAGRAVAAVTVAAATLLAGGAVGAGMVMLGFHYATDTVGGFCLAVAAGLGCALLIDRVADRRMSAGAPAPG